MDESEPLPDHILPQILCNLPMKPLLKFRSVSKTWKNIIDRLLRQPKLLKRSCFIFFWSCIYFGGQKLYIVHEDDDGLFNATRIPWYGPPKYCSFSHSSHGLLCFSSSSFDKSNPRLCRTYIFNPATQRYRRLPNFPSTLTELDNPCLRTGFGLDQSTSKLKVVQIFYEKDSPKTEAFIHTIGGSRYWRKLENVPQVGCPCYGRSVEVSGNLHWATNSPKGILSFDLVSEKFGFSKLPQFRGLSLVNLGGCLSVCDASFEHHVEIWIMKDYNLEKASWTKVVIGRKTFVHSPFTRNLASPVSISKNGDIILLYDTLLVSYNTEKREYSPLQVRDVIGFNVNHRWAFPCWDYRVYPYFGNVQPWRVTIDWKMMVQ